MKVQALLGRLKKLDSPELWLLMTFLGVWLIYKYGLSQGAQVFLGVIFVLAVMVFFIRGILALALRTRIFDPQQWSLLGYTIAYCLLSFVFGWPMLYLAIVGFSSGFVVGVAVAIMSPYTQWR